MAWAALRPAAIASIAVAAPVTTSPPEKTPSTLVSKVFSLTWMVCQRVRFEALAERQEVGDLAADQLGHLRALADGRDDAVARR